MVLAMAIALAMTITKKNDKDDDNDNDNDNDNNDDDDYDNIIIKILPGSTRTYRTCSVIRSAPHTFISNKRLKMMSLLIIEKNKKN